MSALPYSINANLLPFNSIVSHIKNVQIKRPLIHCITNTVVQNFTANILLAVGASPAMIIAEEEIPCFMPIVDGLLINVGTITSSTAKSMLLAAKEANNNKVPWVLDPVAVGPYLPFRSDIAKQLLELRPTLIRCNASEILFLDQKNSHSKCADSLDGIQEAISSADSLAINFNTIVVLTGEIDYITDGKTRLYVTGGHCDLTRLTGTGCALSALVAAFVASNNNNINSAASACSLMARAAEESYSDNGLGTFSVSLLNHLSQPIKLFNES